MKRKLLAILVIALLFAGTGVAYGYWDNLVVEENDVTITVGEGVTLSVSVKDAIPSGVLIPANAVLKAGDLQEVEFSYNVKLDQTVLTDLDLSVVASNVKINGSTANAGLVNIVITDNNSSKVNSSDVVVTITVTLSDPADLAVYNAIYNQDITFDLTFTATQ